MAKEAKAPRVRYVFNYNFLEAVSIIASTAILLSGMVFTSGALTVGSWGHWTLLVVVGSIIALSIVVMVCLVGFETFRAMKYSHLYQKLRYVDAEPVWCCGDGNCFGEVH